ncbi:MAG: hypothetical protein COB41_03300 [Proteobacteria bacterium]|nr:MAG: hypothetical protein COB41_03300 [Pseudomonadota bacterium]
MLISNFFRPSWVFEKAAKKPYRNYIYISFSIATLIVLIKSLTKESKTFTYFQNEELNQFLGILSDPIVSLLITYAIFLGYIYLSFFIGRRLGVPNPFEQYALSIISISFVGIIGHFVSFLLENILPNNFRMMFFYIFFSWVFVWSLLAMKFNFQLSVQKALLVLLLSLLPFFLLNGPLSISPYLSWLI